MEGTEVLDCRAFSIKYAAPGRINLIGEHTDYNGGYVFPGAVDKGMKRKIINEIYIFTIRFTMEKEKGARFL